MYNAFEAGGDLVCIFDYESHQDRMLREKSKSDLFSCPACSESLIVRLGESNRWHFSHKKGAPEWCPLKHSDLAKAAVLSCVYLWLKSKGDEIQNLKIQHVQKVRDRYVLIDIYFERKSIVYLYNICGRRMRSEAHSLLGELYPDYRMNDLHTGKVAAALKWYREQGDSWWHGDLIHKYGHKDYGCDCVMAIDPEDKCVCKYNGLANSSKPAGERIRNVQVFPLSMAGVAPQLGEIVDISKGNS